MRIRSKLTEIKFILQNHMFKVRTVKVEDGSVDNSDLDSKVDKDAVLI